MSFLKSPYSSKQDEFQQSDLRERPGYLREKDAYNNISRGTPGHLLRRNEVGSSADSSMGMKALLGAYSELQRISQNTQDSTSESPAHRLEASAKSHMTNSAGSPTTTQESMHDKPAPEGSDEERNKKIAGLLEEWNSDTEKDTRADAASSDNFPRESETEATNERLTEPALRSMTSTRIKSGWKRETRGRSEEIEQVLSRNVKCLERRSKVITVSFACLVTLAVLCVGYSCLQITSVLGHKVAMGEYEAPHYKVQPNTHTAIIPASTEKYSPSAFTVANALVENRVIENTP